MEVPEEIVSRYLDRRKSDLEHCATWLREKDFVALETIGHQLKGNGVTFGFPILSEMGEKLEEAAQKCDIKASELALKEISHWVQKKLSSDSSL